MNTYLIWGNKNIQHHSVFSINQSPSAPSKPAPEFEEFRQYMDQRISTQETLLRRIAQELGLDKPKQQ